MKSVTEEQRWENINKLVWEKGYFDAALLLGGWVLAEYISKHKV